jgi:hypothetical protein
VLVATLRIGIASDCRPFEHELIVGINGTLVVYGSFVGNYDFTFALAPALSVDLHHVSYCPKK